MDVPEDDSVSDEELHDKYPKWMGTFPYPYMNGTLHLGHAFSVSKVEFAAGWERLKGKRALFPLGFHVTGMPIKASADKIVRELEMFGPDFVIPNEEENAVSDLDKKVDGMKLADDKEEAPQAGAAFHGKKTKTEAKFGKTKYQFQIMRKQGMSNKEIVKFADPEHWLKHYPPIAIEDLSALGCKIDWRRAFLTTDYNPYYDSFARWQFERLHELGKIKFGKRNTIWSPKDGQPCMDHDRQTGEGVDCTEYTCVKLEVLEWSQQAQGDIAAIPELKGKKVFLVAATLRPETMYGQTNCFVGTKLSYGLFRTANIDEVYVVTERAARNMAFQGQSPANSVVEQLGTISGKAIIGAKVGAPLSIYKEGVYVLPMDNVLATKGTGVVTSVPSDSPDDFATLRDLKKKTEFYGIDPKWVEGYEPVPVLSTPAYGEMSAPALCDQLKINSQKDQVQLSEAKHAAYNEGFYNGTMSIGEFKGEPVQEAKTKVRDVLISSGQAFMYAEPDKQVISRSGDECVVALCDQWYFDYGEAEWKALTEKCLSMMETYGEETRHQMQLILDWLKQWACVRTYGLGSKVPWDPTYLIESLSDSTIYMSYYTISHLLHSSLDGSKPGPLGLSPADIDNAAWDYVLLGKDLPSGHSKPEELKKLRRSFLYWYPVDVRSSGKDLIQNHLTFFLYIHTAIFPEQHWPCGIRTNGHLLLNGEKMSKSTGNSLSMREACELYGADATRLTLANAGDGYDDANFEEASANAAILRLYTLMEWVTDAQKAFVLGEKSPNESVQVSDVSLRPASAELSMIDRIFDAEMDSLALATGREYETAMYRDALKNGTYHFQLVRDWYRDITYTSGMHPTLVHKWIVRQAFQLCPFTPHWSEHVWRTVLGNTNSIMEARWPTDIPAEVDHSLIAAGEYIRQIVKAVRDEEISMQKKAAKKKKGAAAAAAAVFDPNAPKTLDIFVAGEFPAWQEDIITVLKDNYETNGGRFDEKAIVGALGKRGLLKNKKAMPFAQDTKKRVQQIGASVFDRAIQFKEIDVLNQITEYLEKNLKYAAVKVIDLADASGSDGERSASQVRAAESSVPGSPGLFIANASQ